MLDALLYATAMMIGSLFATAAREWQKFRPAELKGALQGTSSMLAGVMFISLLVFPFLLWPWWVGVAAPIACALASAPVITYSRLMEWTENRGIQRTKNMADFCLIALALVLWARYVGVV